MIFVILGTQKFQLNRLLKAVDKEIEKGSINEEVIVQSGSSDYEAEHFEIQGFINKDQFDDYISKADIIITHSGVGSIITTLKYKKPVIVYPRLKKYGEHVDDHQLDIATAFEKKGLVLCCRENDDLGEIINKCRITGFNQYVSNREKIINIINDFIENI